MIETADRNDQAGLAWVNAYVGVPYLVNGRTRAGWDCWGLVLAVYRDQLGLELPDWRRAAPFGLAAQARAFREAWRALTAGLALELEAPAPFALVFVARAPAPHHVGVVAGGGVLHCAAPTHGTTWEPLRRFRAAYAPLSWWQWQR
jgi:cell wall-associated NlpC family hydrolase